MIFSNFSKNTITGILFFLMLSGIISGNHKTCTGNDHMLNNNWKIISSEKLNVDGSEISAPSFNSEGWYTTQVPSTVMAALIENKVYENVYFSKNLEKISAESFKSSWWYRSGFEWDGKNSNHVDLIFEGINYRADVWLNGEKIADKETFVGTFNIHKLDVTSKLVKGKNALALEIFPSQPGDFSIGFVDWNPRPQDKNMGIWRPVKLRSSGAVSLNDPFVSSTLDLKNYASAEIRISGELVNHSDEEITARVMANIGELQIEKSYKLKASEKKVIIFSVEEFSQLKLENPKLWWPYNLGTPHLYELDLKVKVNDNVSDKHQVKFGIREVSDYVTEDGYRGYKINGREILIRGGGWVDDIFLRECPEKVEAQLLYVKSMNLNTVRLEGFWGNGKTLYDLCDKHGILLMPGWSCEWEWKGYFGGIEDDFMGIKTPEEIELMTRSYMDQVRYLRNHPSIFVWVFGSDKLPRPALEKKLNTALAETDQTRPVLTTCAFKISEISGPSGVRMDGPYDYVTPQYWYEFYKGNTRGAFGFNTEIGPGPQPPVLESLKKMIPENKLWPINDEWSYHCGRNEFNDLDWYLKVLHNRYGQPENVEDFCQISQVANYEAMRAMFEAFGIHKQKATGVVQWMLNSAWPEMYWQLYDYYLMPNGAFYAAKKANRPVNVAYNYGTKTVYVVNESGKEIEQINVEINVYDFDSRKIFSKNLTTDIDMNTSRKILDLPEFKNITPVYFLDIKMKNKKGKYLGDNFYWLSTKPDVLNHEDETWYATSNKEYADFTAIKDLKKNPVNISANAHVVKQNDQYEAQIDLHNKTDKIAFFIELSLLSKTNNQSVLPVFWDDNYISLAPGEKRSILVKCSKEDLDGEQPVLLMNGINVEKTVINQK